MEPKDIMSSGVKVEPHNSLNTVTEAQFRKTAVEVLRCADQGVQTLVITANGARTVVGLNGCRFLPDPPDPQELLEWSNAEEPDKKEEHKT